MTDTHWTTNGATPFRRLLPLTAQPARALDKAFAEGRPGVIPAGSTSGIGLALTGTWVSRPLAWFYWLFWKGKIFDRQAGKVVNRILPFDLRAIRTSVRTGNSLIDGRPCVVIDYSELGFIGRMVRDEIRQIEPGIHLGYMFIGGRRVMKFALAEHGGA